MTAASVKIAERLRNLDTEFTSDLLASELGVTRGSVSGYLAKCVLTGAVALVRREGKTHVYTVVNPDLLVSREARSLGGKAGRSVTSTTEADRMIGLLGTVGEWISSHRPRQLRDYTTSELLRELSRRDREAARASEEEPKS